MTIKTNIWTIILLLAHVCHGQTLKLEGVVYKMNSSKGLPYVSIGVKGSARGTVSDSFGAFSIQVTKSDSLVFSFVGLKSRTISVREFKNPVFLEEETMRLNEVVVQSNKKIGAAVLGNTKSKTDILFGGSNQYALLLKNNEHNEGVLEKLYFYVHSDIDKHNLFETFVKIHVYQNENNLPGSDLLSKNIVATIKEKEKKIIVDVSGFDIVIPQEGLFIGIDLLGIFDKNETFVPYNKSKIPLNLRMQFSTGDSCPTYSKFFGTDWTKVVTKDRNGNLIDVSAKFGAKVSY